MARYNWIELKRQFFESDCTSVEEFLREKGIARGGGRTNAGHYSRKTKGWEREKKEMQLQANQEAKDKMIKELQPYTEDLLKTKKALLSIINNKMVEEKSNLSSGDIKNFWFMIKTELSEPTTVNDNRNDHTSKGEQMSTNTQVIFEDYSPKDEDKTE